MTVQFTIFDDRTQALAAISKNGEVITGDYAHSDSYFGLIDNGSAIEVIPGKVGFDFITMAFWIAAKKSVSPSVSANIIVYEANRHDLNTNLNTKINIDLAQNQTFASPSRLRMVTCTGCSLVATTTDPTVTVTIVGYYEPHRD